MDYEQALANLYGRVNLETQRLNDPPDAFRPPRQLEVPSLDRLRRVMAYLGDPQLDLPILHITGTNGKGSTARMATSLLVSSGRSVGLFTSPDLQRVTERLASAGPTIEPISDAEFGDVVATMALAEQAAGEHCSFFEAITAMAYRWFSDLAVEAAVIEVGVGGRWDATNVANAGVAAITNIELDHQEYLGTTKEEIATEKAGIIKPGATAVLGETADPAIVALLHQQAVEHGASLIWQRDLDFACERNRLSLAGRVVDLRTPGARYDDVFVPLHGRHQGDNAALALAAVEAFVGEPLSAADVVKGFASVTHPGRMEVLGRRPLVLLDGAHNPAGARAAAVTLNEEFAAVTGRVLVLGLLSGRDPKAMLEAIEASRAKLVVAVAPPSPRALDPELLVRAARDLGIEARMAGSVSAALEVARGATEEGDVLLVTGSMYLVGAVRTALLGSAGDTHRR